MAIYKKNIEPIRKSKKINKKINILFSRIYLLSEVSTYPWALAVYLLWPSKYILCYFLKYFDYA